ncbi:MAG TPA: hypothetical protein VGF22_21290 [Acidimicrobiales bacterium]|jgi:hypothetical protein
MGELLSRRTLFGAGVVTGAGLLLPPIIEAPRAFAAEEPTFTKRSLRLTDFDFQPEAPQDGRFVSTLGTFADLVDANVEALVRLPAGAVPTNVEWKVFNGAAGPTTVVVYQLTWPNIALDAVGFTQVDPSNAGLQTVQTPLTATPADPNLYLLRMPTLRNGTRAVYTAELFYNEPNPPSPAPTQTFVPIAPGRVYDSRVTGGKVHDGEERVVSLAHVLTGTTEVVPSGAIAAALTATVTETEGAGYVAVFPADAPWGGTSSLNWFGPDQNLATAVISKLDADRQVKVRGGVNPTHVVIDVAGYWLS